jgi:RNA polymerase sigma factor (sigma-70 family)
MNELFQSIEKEIPRLRRYARALTRDVSAADDLVQDCLTRALGKAHLWREGTDLRAWLFTILHNQHVNRVRRTIREGISVNAEDVEWALVAPSSQFARVELRELGAALDRLPEEQRQVVLLVGLEGLRYEAVAEIMGVPVGTIRSRLSRGREALRQMMGGEAEGTRGNRHVEEAGRTQRRAAIAAPARRALA